MHPPRRSRNERIDALRGIAVFGILLINVWVLAKGSSQFRYGLLEPAAPWWEHMSVWFCAAFAEAKFYPIFAFLFGAGFALQMRSLRRAQGAWQPATERYRRRLTWLLACGLLHGSLIWYGDILTAYALTGFWLLRAAGRPLAQVRRLLHLALFVNAAILAFLILGVLGMEPSTPGEVSESVLEAARTRAVYNSGSWREIALQRLADFGANIVNFVFFLPELAMLFLLGVVALRLGWLTRPWRHRRLWRKVQLAGFAIGIPINLWWGAVALAEALDPYANALRAAVAHTWLTLGGPVLAGAYVASVMLAGARVARWLGRWFAPVGRMALSNYLMQSVLGVILLQGVGLGWGAQLSRTGLLLYCAAIMLVQLCLSRWWLARHAQGPLEALWRRYTYLGEQPRAPASKA
ncbi:MAG: DUF418 domain-containing protein [Telluria sp.]|nr:DUF418 domain-containing protein [Telluria sp.]